MPHEKAHDNTKVVRPTEQPHALLGALILALRFPTPEGSKIISPVVTLVTPGFDSQSKPDPEGRRRSADASAIGHHDGNATLLRCEE